MRDAISQSQPLAFSSKAALKTVKYSRFTRILPRMNAITAGKAIVNQATFPPIRRYSTVHDVELLKCEMHLGRRLPHSLHFDHRKSGEFHLQSAFNRDHPVGHVLPIFVVGDIISMASKIFNRWEDGSMSMARDAHGLLSRPSFDHASWSSKEFHLRARPVDSVP